MVGQFQLYTGPDRIGITNICRYLDNRGVKPRNGDTWTECSIMGILRNIVNDQRVGIGRRKIVKQVQNGSVSKVRPHSDYDFTAPGLQPRLIDHDVFLEAQTHLGKNSHKLPESYGIKNPLAGIVVCSCCGKKMMRRPASKTPGGAPYDVSAVHENVQGRFLSCRLPVPADHTSFRFASITHHDC